MKLKAPYLCIDANKELFEVGDKVFFNTLDYCGLRITSQYLKSMELDEKFSLEKIVIHRVDDNLWFLRNEENGKFFVLKQRCPLLRRYRLRMRCIWVPVLDYGGFEMMTDSFIIILYRGNH